ncbi:MAG: M16 family metallopeptidase [Candidatus Omnitrophota bacterium]
MKKLGVVFLIIVLSLAFSIHGSATTTPKANPTGLKLVPLKVTGEPIIAFNFVFHTGSMDDPEGKCGLANLTAQLMAEGGTQTDSYKAILEKLFPIAGSYTVSVDREYISFTGETHADNIESFYTLFKDALLKPGFSEEDFNRIKSAAIDSIKNTLRYSSDEELGKAVFKSFVYRGTAYEKPVIGKVSDLEQITLADVKQFYKTHFLRTNLIAGISGNFSDAMLNRIKTDFSALPGGTIARKPIKPEAINGIQVLIVDKPSESAGIHIGFPIDVMRKDPDFYALFLANSWFGEHRSSASHLYQVIREARGFNYGDYSYVEDFPRGGERMLPPTNVCKNPQLFEIWLRPMEKDKRVFALRAALRELKLLVDHGMTRENFELTKNYLSRHYLHYAVSGAKRLGYKIDDGIYGLKESYLENFRKHIDGLTLEKVNNAIKKHLRCDNLKIVCVTGDGEKLKADLTGNVVSSITYRTPKPEEVLNEDKIIEAFPLKILPENVRIIDIDHVFK